MKILHLCLCGAYADDYEYQDNILPLKHYEMGNEVTVFVSPLTWKEKGVLGERKAQDYINKYGYKICVLSYKDGTIAKSLRIFKNFYNKIEEENPDVIFCHGGLFYSYPKLVEYVKKHKNVRLYLDSHIDTNISGIEQKKGFAKVKRYCAYRFFWGHCVRRISRYSKKVWGVTPARVDFLMNVFRVPKSKVGLLVMGGNESAIQFDKREILRKELRSKAGIAENAFVCVTAGKFDRFKNIPELINAFKNMQKPNIVLVMLGAADNEMQSEIVQLKKNMSNIYDEGWCDTKTIYDWFLASDLAVFPGRHSVLWEQAVATGLPCCIRRAKGMEHVDVGGNCMFMDNIEPHYMANMLEYIATNKEVYDKMLMVARNKGIKEFSYMEIAKRSIEERM